MLLHSTDWKWDTPPVVALEHEGSRLNLSSTSDFEQLPSDGCSAAYVKWINKFLEQHKQVCNAVLPILYINRQASSPEMAVWHLSQVLRLLTIHY